MKKSKRRPITSSISQRRRKSSRPFWRSSRCSYWRITSRSGAAATWISRGTWRSPSPSNKHLLLAVNDLGVLDASGGVARIDYQLCFLNNLFVVVIGVVGDDEHTVIFAQVLEFRALHLQIVFSSLADEREVRVVITHHRAIFLQQLDDGKRGGFAQVVDVFLVGYAQHQHTRAVDRFLVAIECAAHRGQNVVGHVGVDFSREFDEAGAEIPFLGLP